MARSALAHATLVDIRQARVARNRAEAEEFRLIAQFGELNTSVCGDSGVVLEGTERLVEWGGDGTPAVAEFCSLEVALMLRVSDESARSLLGHALGAKYRLPLMWEQTMTGEIRVWQTRDIVSETHPLTAEQAGMIDAELVGLWSTMAWTRIVELVKGRVLELLGREADTDVERRRKNMHVSIHNAFLGASDVGAVIPSPDAVLLDGTLNRIADILRAGGTEGTRQNLRAIALGVLGTPARALQMIQASLLDQLPQDFDPTNPSAGGHGPDCGRITVDPDRLLPKTSIVLHMTDVTACRGSGIVRGEGIGPMLAHWVKDLVGHTRVTVRPVYDPEASAPVDSYEVPAHMRRGIALRNPYEVFPWTKKPMSGLDLDHTQPWRATQKLWDQDPPPPTCHCSHGEGLTRLDNLGPVSRKVHRAKTHGGWKLTQPAPGTFIWTSPQGFTWLQTPSQSWLIDDPTGRLIERVVPQIQVIPHHTRAA